ncbi:hypothetical protein F4553_003970 [Allocatelliglobosispora scoriae]|uniref:RloB domain-containing protein n=1 Tax=Allocatelliglobosispora scoriae TaxID=643052 RepID=A0A841BV15_9ACTN|nr:RloB family protein [Allocatelliglobosispora scoriae]MBB5870591.1 hypothetical protein [Allocatelliglobosispora scoriae]
MGKGRSSRNERRPIRVGVGRETNFNRETDLVSSRLTILIVTNGEDTEMDYLKALKGEAWVRLGRVVVAFENGDPLNAVETARKRRIKDDFDHAWVVSDVDDFDVDKAQALAVKCDIELMLSKPCFEFWLLLHFEYSDRFFENCGKVGDKLTGYLPAWDKTRLDYSHFRQNVFEAAKRAKRLHSNPDSHSKTDLWRLVELLSSEEAGL